MGQRSSGDSQTPRAAGTAAAQPHAEAAGEAGGLDRDPVIMALLRNIPRTEQGRPALASPSDADLRDGRFAHLRRRD